MVGAIICIVICILAIVFAAINGRAADDSLALPSLIVAGIAFLGIFIFATLPVWLAIIIVIFLIAKAFEAFG